MGVWMEVSYRKRLIKLLTFLGGIYFFVQFVMPEKALDALGWTPYHEPISYGFIAIGSAAFGLGLINLFLVHGSRIVFRRTGWSNSLALLLGLLLMMGVSARDWLAGLATSSEVRTVSLLSDFSKKIKSDAESHVVTSMPAGERNKLLKDAVVRLVTEKRVWLSSTTTHMQFSKPENEKLSSVYHTELLASLQRSETGASALDLSGKSFEANELLTRSLQESAVAYGKFLKIRYEESVTKRLFDFLNFGFFVALGSAMFSLLGVYIAAAAYRAFRIRTFESSLMMLAAVVVMLGQIPFGVWLFSDLPQWRLWLLEVPNSAAFRAIKIGASIAGLVLAFRMWFSIESDSFSEEPRG